jgi:hypothetical protein
MGLLFNAFKAPCLTGDWVVILPAAFPELKEWDNFFWMHISY